ncbi:hypothetical protein ORN63_001745 [Vibrio parahaemolyticus]|nr:hypothetical protein [Vibrio parahaemolyticus]EGQ9533348.1 hypothetical protein [Vibrio parahaemolyticus]EHZ7354859.1 hypothetical protein [Vibrio parahaemolyticus]EIA1325948.1 hypothetical protein [Vibrio parahaemolyticus]EIE1184948.1 hypothetical protein [Vibrio parahaemolyticus]
MFFIKKIYNKYQFLLNRDNYLSSSVTHLINNCFDLLIEKEIEAIDRKKHVDNLYVSLTSYGERINNVHLVIYSLIRQKQLPAKITLWLAHGEEITDELSNLQKMFDFFSIEFTNDIKSYKKFIPEIKIRSNDDIIITADDDIIYPPGFVEILLKSYIKEPNFVHGFRAHMIRYGWRNKIKPYSKWDFETDNIVASKDTFLTTGAGVIFKVGDMPELLVDENLACQLCEFADDVWLNFVLRKYGIKRKRINSNIMNGFFEIPCEGVTALNQLNVLGYGNDNQINRFLKYFSDNL